MNVKDGERCFGWGAQGEFGDVATVPCLGKNRRNHIVNWLSAWRGSKQLVDWTLLWRLLTRVDCQTLQRFPPFTTR